MKQPVVTGKKVIQVLSKMGFKVVRQKGSHVRLEKETNEKTIKLTVPLHSIIKKGTLRMILTQAEITLEEFIQQLKK